MINSAGNGANTCSQFAYDFALELGRISWLQNIAPHYGCDPNGNGDDCDPEAVTLQACDLGVAYICRTSSICSEFYHRREYVWMGAKPGPILRDHLDVTTISSHITIIVIFDGTSYSTPIEIAAEIKKSPHYSNEEIAQLIFSTAHEAGEEGVDEVYGHGILNPKDF